MSATPVIAIFDVGKTNKKLFLFDENYRIVYERSAKFIETVDEDGDPCENLESLRLSVFDSLNEIFRQKQFEVKAINFSAYGASFVYIDELGKPLTPLYNYLKDYPREISDELYYKNGGSKKFSIETASPVLGSLNSGLQLLRLKKEQPEVFSRLKYALHLPQYLSFLVSGETYSDLTSIGCHTALWDFNKNDYHDWVLQEGIAEKLAPIVPASQISPAIFPGSNIKVGIGLHDSSAALIPYLVSFNEPFVLISTGTWCISLNPFNDAPLTAEELEQDCLCYLQYQGKPVKASRLFSGYEHEHEVKRITEHFHGETLNIRSMNFDPQIIAKLKLSQPVMEVQGSMSAFAQRDLNGFSNGVEAYHQFIVDLVALQKKSTQLVLNNTAVKRIFVDGGFGKNIIYMNLLALAFPQLEIFAASMAQATAMGAALALHKEWNKKSIPNDIIELKYYSSNQTIAI